MKAAFKTLLGVALVLSVAFVATAEEKKKEAGKEVTLKGTITCAKCDLKKEAKCATVIKVGDTVYYFDDVSGKKYHKEICTDPKKGQVTGTVSKKGEKMIVTVTDLKFD